MQNNKDMIKKIGPQNYTYQIDDMTNLGTSESCQIQLSGEEISDRHARIERKNGQTYLRDMRSQSGTYINDVRVIEAELQDGDIIRIGQNEFIYMKSPSPMKTSFPLTSKNEEFESDLQLLANAAKTDFSVLILGPSGAGKDVIAQALHQESNRKSGTLISVNCSALTETLIESELFGHLKGSFTGAIADRKGAFEAARGGTLFLDEIGDLPLALQAKLLRALENKEIRPVGSDRTIKTDTRIIAATHQNLHEKIRAGEFRADLFYRLNVVCIKAPALNERMEDFESLLYTFARELRVRFSFGATQRLKQHAWAGNIRELRNLVLRASAFYPKMQIEEAHIEKLLAQSSAITGDPNCQPPTNALPVIKEIERQMIIKRLSANRGNQRKTASDLGIPKSTLHDRLKKYQIKITEFKA